MPQAATRLIGGGTGAGGGSGGGIGSGVAAQGMDAGWEFGAAGAGWTGTANPQVAGYSAGVAMGAAHSMQQQGYASAQYAAAGGQQAVAPGAVMGAVPIPGNEAPKARLGTARTGTIGAALRTRTRPHVLNSFFMEDQRRQMMQRNTELRYAYLESDHPAVADLPQVVNEEFHSLYPLDEQAVSKTLGLSTCHFKAMSMKDATVVTLRRIYNTPRLAHELFHNALSSWQAIMPHPHLVTLRAVITSRDFDDLNDLIFVYDYHPGAESLEIATAVRAIHAAGRACRILDLSSVLLIDRNTHRIKVNGCGLKDVLNFASVGKKSLAELQYEDLLAVGNIILQLACKSHTGSRGAQEQLAYVSQHYSTELKDILTYLLTKGATIQGLASSLATRTMEALEESVDDREMLEEQLSKELDNGRIVRSMVKLGFINERPEHNRDERWSETGDRYMLKLFRDYVFHQVNEEGKPVLDLAHVIECLNKLEVGSAEKVLLASRDNKSLMIVRYSDLKKALSTAFTDLAVTAAAARQSAASHHHQ